MSHLSTFATKTKFINIDTLTAALTRCGFVDVGRTKFVSYADISDALRNNRPTQPIPSHECLRAFGVGPDIRQAAAQIRSEYSRQKLPLYELGIVQSKSDPQAYEVHGDFLMASDLWDPFLGNRLGRLEMVYNAEEAKATAIANGHAIIEDSLVGNELTLRTQPLYVHA